MRQSSSKLIYRIRIVFTWGALWWNELKEAASKACRELAKGQKSKELRGRLICRLVIIFPGWPGNFVHNHLGFALGGLRSERYEIRKIG
jgi:hypothetical protein